ncbi:MAG: DUF368 domain-containing protein, partial [Planctomycetota bacterium]
MTTPDQLESETNPIDPNIGTMSNEKEIVSTERPEGSMHADVLNVVRGFCMGAADTVPGVSGGTVALILGHYQRLVAAISQIDTNAFKLVLGRRWAEAWGHLDARFLVAIGLGVGTGLVTLAGVMHWLLDEHLPQTFAVFFGLILASIVIVGRAISQWKPVCWVGCVLGVIVAFAIGTLTPTVANDYSLPYLFVASSVAICAMILPGISGAFVLLLFGVYHPVTGMIKGAVKGEIDLQVIVQLGTVACGCLFGLLAFTRLLRWLLANHRDVTMASLIGLMIGSCAKLWPLQVATDATKELKMKERVMEYVSPADFSGSLVLLVLLAVGAAVAVLALERVASSLGEAK